jgi:S1-C subfamily serine protease
MRVRERDTLLNLAVHLCVLATLVATEASALVTNNILTRVFMIRNADQTGSAFAIEKDGRQYLVTARHIMMQAKDGDAIALLREGKWADYTIKRVPVEPDSADIAVLALPSPLPQALHSVDFDLSVTLSEEVYFLGFPYGLVLPGVVASGGFHIPLVKRGIISSMGQEQGVFVLLLDGHNNPGFSGGPIVRSRGTANPVILGVISGYRWAGEPIEKGGAPTEFVYRANTGIIIGVGIRHALDAIDRRPIGPKVSEGK